MYDINRVFASGKDLLFRKDTSDKECYPDLKIKNCKPEYVIVGRIVEVNGKSIIKLNS